jgi:hypothetical protein
MSDSAHVTAGSVTIPQPAGWEDRTVLTLVGPASGGTQPNVVVTRESLCANLGRSRVRPRICASSSGRLRACACGRWSV